MNVVDNPHNLLYRNVGEFFNQIYRAKEDTDLNTVLKNLRDLPRQRSDVHRLEGKEIARVRGMLRKRAEQLRLIELGDGSFRKPLEK